MDRRHFCRSLLGAGLAAALPRPSRAAPETMQVDTHAHVFKRGLKLADNRRYAPDHDATIPDYLAMLDRNGMTHGVLIQPSFLGTDNAYLCEALRAAPERLRGIAVVRPETGRDALAELARDGVVGIRLNLIGQPDPAFGTDLWRRHLADVAALGWQVEVHAEARRLPDLLPPLIEAGLPVVVDHFGRPDPRLGVEDPGFRSLLGYGAGGRVFVKLSAAYRNGAGEAAARTADRAAEQLRGAFDAHRLLWGSDWPHTQFEGAVNPADTLRALAAWVPDPAARRIVLGESAARLFKFRTRA